MLNSGIIYFERADCVGIYYGNKFDTTDFASDKYIQINSCGFQEAPIECTVVRRRGRLDYHILLTSKGICEAVFKDKVYNLGEGNLIIYAPGEKQKYILKPNCQTLWLHFSGTIIKEVLDSCGISSGVYFLKPSDAVFDAFSKIIQRFNSYGQKRFANASLLELLFAVSGAINNPSNEKVLDSILPVVSYMNINYNKQLTLDELAKISGYSKSRFSHLFVKAMGAAPIKYLNNNRLKNACEMLSSSNLSVGEIAYSCGFNDQLYFCRLFKQRFGKSPSEYRETAVNSLNDY